MKRRDRAAFGESHLVAAIASAPREPRGYVRYARWLKAKGRLLEAEAQYIRAKHCTRLDFGFDYSRLEAATEMKVVPFAAGTVVRLLDGEWPSFWCDALEAQEWTVPPDPENGPNFRLPGEVGMPSNDVCQRLWEEGIEVPGFDNVRRVAGEARSWVRRDECPVEGETFTLEVEERGSSGQ